MKYGVAPSLPSLPGPFRSWVIVLLIVPLVSQIEWFYHLLWIIIIIIISSSDLKPYSFVQIVCIR